MAARYFVHAPSKGVPPLGSVLTPTMTRPYGAWSSNGVIAGHPGTRGIPVEDPAGIREDVNSLAAVGQFSSAAAPNVIYPSLYWEADTPGNKEKFPGSVFSDNQMPVPATAARKLYLFSPFRTRKGGQKQVVQPQVVQRFPGLYGRSG